MIIGDRVFFQKNIDNVKFGELGTIVSFVDEYNLIVRVCEDFIGTNTSSIRKATKDEIASCDSQKIINLNFKNGSLHIVRTKDCTDRVSIGDVGFIIGSTAGENEQDDLFTIDFGNDLLKLDKKFMDVYMGKYNHKFEKMLIKDDSNS